MSKAKIKTARTTIFKITCDREVDDMKGVEPRDVYLAFPRFDDIPRPIVTVTIFAHNGYVEWVETSEQHRRMGFATEVMRAIDTLVGDLQVEGVTDAGKAFVDSLYGAKQ